MKISAGSAQIGGPLCFYDEDGNAIAMVSSKRLDKEEIALAIVKAVNDADKAVRDAVAEERAELRWFAQLVVDTDRRVLDHDIDESLALVSLKNRAHEILKSPP